MKKFKFKLEPLFTYRKYQERVAQQKTAKAQLDVKNCEKEISRLEQTWDDQADAMDAAARDGIPASRFQQHYGYLTAVESGIAVEKMRRQELSRILNEKLLELKKKSVDKRAMEVYRDKMKTHYTREMIHEEQKELDEISTLKTARMSAQ